jgi:hypothetical protein
MSFAALRILRADHPADQRGEPDAGERVRELALVRARLEFLERAEQ